MTHISRRGAMRLFGTAAVGTAAGTALGNKAWAKDETAQAGAADFAAMAVRKGLDYSWGRPRPTAIAAAGYSFVCRYVSRQTNGKNLTRSEADALRAVGLDIVTNWENTAGEALGGYSAGAAYATEANSQALTCGMPASRPIYFSVDFDSSAAQQPTINAYFDGIASVIGRGRTGAYGGYGVINRLLNAGKINWGWQTHAWSGGNWDSRAQLRQVRNEFVFDGARVDENEAHATDFGQWGGGPNGAASIYGVDAENHLTYTVVDAATGTRTHGTKTSAATLGFTAVAMATLNFNTVLITSTAGQLWRVDVITNNDSLVFNPPVLIGGGWTHDKLAYDGNGHLYGTYEGHLLRYNITTAKPSSIGGRLDIGRGFVLKTLTTTGPDWILGTVADGRLMSYKINGAAPWDDHTLRATTWQTIDHLLSPGGGFYLAHKPDGSMSYYIDANPYNGTATDMTNARLVDTRGWTQTLLSAQPNTVH